MGRYQSKQGVVLTASFQVDLWHDIVNHLYHEQKVFHRQSQRNFTNAETAVALTDGVTMLQDIGTRFPDMHDKAIESFGGEVNSDAVPYQMDGSVLTLAYILLAVSLC